VPRRPRRVSLESHMGSYVLTWRPLAGGHFAIGHKPGRKLREQLERQGCTLVVSLLSEKESNAEENQHRIRLTLAGADLPSPQRTPEIIATFERMHAALREGGRLYLHCSAGLHRTGMIANAFLRWLGYSAEDALASIAELRPLTAEKVGEERLQWGEGFAGNRR
jgi:protein-tyrosine phosphatase